MAKFINREKEVTYLKNWLDREPNSLLFVYGPKSSGKTTLMTQLIDNHLDLKKMAINYMNLRGVLIYNFNSFLDTFFTKTTKGKLREILAGVSINLGFFKVGLDDEALLKQNPFRVMEGQLTEARKKGLTPVLIIDEIQNLKNIYINGERYLLDELFNLFVRLTKELHVAHVILLTSDSYFLEEVYSNAKLIKTTEYFYVEHLSKKDIRTWLLAEGLAEEEIALVWKLIGGSPWEISQILFKYKDGIALETACQFFINDGYARLFHYLPKKFNPTEIAIIQEVHREIIQKGYAHIGDFPLEVQAIISKMVEKDFWFYHYDQQKITANSESMRWAMKRMHT